jgi:hypothetical protein
MKIKLLSSALLTVFLMAMMPSVQAVEFDTATETQKAWIEEQVATLDIEELMKYLLAGEGDASFEQELAKNELANCILMPIKWLANILLKVLMLPVKMVINVMVKLLVLPFKALSVTLKLMLLPIKLLLLPLKIALIPLKALFKIITFPFRLINLMAFLLCPFKHPLYR